MTEAQRRQRVIEGLPIGQIVGEYLAQKPSPTEQGSTCPFHDARHQTLTTDPMTSRFYCSICGAGGDVVDFVSLFERVTQVRAIEMIEARLGL